MSYIEHIIEPEKLLLSCQTSQPGRKRGRMIVAELHRRVDNADLVYLRDSSEYQETESLGFDGYPGFKSNQQRYENILFAFMKRLPPRSRGDFGKYFDSLRIRNEAVISDFALLDYSGAKLTDDDFTIIQTFENEIPPFEFLLQIQGYRYYKERLPFGDIELEQKAIFQMETENEFDPKAIKILLNEIHIGYVCHGITKSFHKWFNIGYIIDAYIERKNGTIERPEIFLYVSVKKPNT